VTEERPRRAFWVHQAAEYLIGIALVASGLQSPSPTVPAVLGGIVIVNAAIVDGPLGAFRAIGRRAHRILDIVVLVLIVVGAAWPGVDPATRILVVGLGIVMCFVVAKTNYGEARRRVDTAASSPGAPGSRGERFGRTAGRLTALGVQGVRKGLDGAKNRSD
jgi:hypothetical protein